MILLDAKVPIEGIVAIIIGAACGVGFMVALIMLRKDLRKEREKRERLEKRKEQKNETISFRH
jgi:uncharacterized membrane protein SpoIIM required for sporulation